VFESFERGAAAIKLAHDYWSRRATLDGA
jgi:hypothetical protein